MCSLCYRGNFFIDCPALKFPPADVLTLLQGQFLHRLPGLEVPSAPSQAPGRLCDFWATESIWAYVKPKIAKAVSKHPRWRKGVGPQHGRVGRVLGVSVWIQARNDVLSNYTDTCKHPWGRICG